jgi:hypothetical protein
MSGKKGTFKEEVLVGGRREKYYTILNRGGWCTLSFCLLYSFY